MKSLVWLELLILSATLDLFGTVIVEKVHVAALQGVSVTRQLPSWMLSSQNQYTP
jgi:hypothetical protein